ncbi:MAG: sugar phosphate isomerase/epimerase [Calditrichaeota bacterium]|nr:sugar phosphate isomerase/epimerase [Calditrichota bacterium]
MGLQLGATVFFNRPEEFEMILKVVQKYPFVQYIEFRGEAPFFFPGITPQSDFKFYREVLSRTPLKTTIHTTMYDINLATLNPRIKEANIKSYKEYIDLAAYFESEIIVLHDGEVYQEFARSPRREEFLQIAERHLIETLVELADYGQQKGVKVALENAPPQKHVSLVWNAENHTAMLQKINHPNLGALFDVAHAFLHGLDIPEYLEAIHPYLLEIHAHNNMGEKDDHLGLPNGKIDYLSILKHPVVDGVPFIMEIRSYDEVIHTLEWLKAHGFAE